MLVPPASKRSNLLIRRATSATPSSFIFFNIRGIRDVQSSYHCSPAANLKALTNTGMIRTRFGNDGKYRLLDVLRMTASHFWEHNQGTVALFQHIDRYLMASAPDFHGRSKSPTHANPPSQKYDGEELFFSP